MENKNKTMKKILIGAGVIILTVLISVISVNTSLFTSLLSQNTNPVVRGDVYIPQNYQASKGQIGEIEIKAGKVLSKVAGMQFTVNYPTNSMTIVDASASGLATSNFFIVKNTNTPGAFQISMAQATGINLNMDDVIIKLTVEISTGVKSGDKITLSLNNLSFADENASTLSVTAKNGEIAITDGGTLPGTEPYIQSIIPDYGLSSQETKITIKGKNFPSHVSEVSLGNTALTNVKATSAEITATVPKGFTTGIYNLSITGTDGTRINKEKAFTIIEQAEGLSVDIEDSYFAPKNIKNDDTMETTLWVKVTDTRGIEDIEYVNANLENIGGTPTNRMKADKIVDKSQWFYMDKIKIPKTIPTSSTPYEILISVTNKIGKVATGKIPLIVAGDIETNIAPVIRQAYTVPPYVPNNGQDTFSLYAYITSDNGPDTLGNVMIDLSSIGEGVKTMQKEGSAVGNGYWYKVDNLKVSTQVRSGDRRLTITASNTTGDTTEKQVVVEINTFRNAPTVESLRSYTTPSVVANDGNTDVTLYALVIDPDGAKDIESVNIDLREIGLSPINRMELVEKGAEGIGQWYKFSTKVPTIISASDKPYELKVTATDRIGSLATGKVHLKVLNTNPTNIIAPQIEAVVPVSSHTIEAIFNKSLDNISITGAGRNFRILARNDIGKSLNILKATLNTKGNIVILETEEQEDMPYSLIASEQVRDVYGNPVKPGYGDKADFYGFKKDAPKNNPSMKLITATSPTTLEVDFSEPLKPSSLALDGSTIQIFELNNNVQVIKAKEVHFKDDASTIIITTENQKYGMSYTIVISDIESSLGVVGKTLKGFFKGFTTPLIGDLNLDKKVDFVDFTIFASVYRASRGFENCNMNFNFNFNINTNTNTASSNANTNAR